jgi:hypothetical protein
MVAITIPFLSNLFVVAKLIVFGDIPAIITSLAGYISPPIYGGL